MLFLARLIIEAFRDGQRELEKGFEVHVGFRSLTYLVCDLSI
jgi:hypothetical protein